MNSKLTTAIAFVAGAASGAAGMFIFMKKKWLKGLEEKQQEMLDYYKNKREEVIDKKEETTIEEKPTEEIPAEKRVNDIHKAENIIRKYDYAKISKPEKTKNEEASILNDPDYSDYPYEIDPREFGTQEMYEMLTLYLHDSGELLTEKYEPLDDESIDDYIGLKNLEKIADRRDQDPELDSYYIRNDRLKIDFEILIGAEAD